MPSGFHRCTLEGEGRELGSGGATEVPFPRYLELMVTGGGLDIALCSSRGVLGRRGMAVSERPPRSAAVGNRERVFEPQVTPALPEEPRPHTGSRLTP